MMMMPMDLQLFLDLQYEAAVHLLVHNMQRCFQIISSFFVPMKFTQSNEFLLVRNSWYLAHSHIFLLKQEQHNEKVI